MTPVQVRRLLVYYYMAEISAPFTESDIEAETWLISNSLITRECGTLTDKGRCLVEAILSIPMPVMNYTIPWNTEKPI